MSIDDLRRSDVMRHLLDALDEGEDIGHYGQLVFAMVGRHFLSEDELVKELTKSPDISEDDARNLYRQVEAHNYNPPRREKILEWQAKQDFAICPAPDDPSACNVYADLEFPDQIYEQISEFYEDQPQPPLDNAG